MPENYMLVVGSISSPLLQAIRAEVIAEWPGGEYSIETEDFTDKLSFALSQILATGHASSISLEDFFQSVYELPLSFARIVVIEGAIYEALCGNNPLVATEGFKAAEEIYIASPRDGLEWYRRVK